MKTLFNTRPWHASVSEELFSGNDIGCSVLLFGLIGTAYKHEEALANPWSDIGGLSAQCAIFEGSQEMHSRFPLNLASEGGRVVCPFFYGLWWFQTASAVRQDSTLC